MSLKDDLLRAGYLPENLPPPFHTEKIAEFFSNNPSSYICDQKHPLRAAVYNASKRGESRRSFSAIHPITAHDLAEFLQLHAVELDKRFQKNSVSLSVPRHTPNGERALEISSHNHLEVERLGRLSGYRFIAKTDISRFYHSIYTHSVSWAFHGKAAAKKTRRFDASDVYFNRLDFTLRQGQDGQTIGIPVGPDASRYVAELICTAIDDDFVSRIEHDDISFIRHVDDVWIGAQSHSSVERALWLFPEEGPLRSDQFSGGDATVRAKLEALGFRVRASSESSRVQINFHDIELLRLSRDRDRYADISSEERATYERVHAALGQLGRIVQEELGAADYDLRLTSGFHLRSGVRGALPKDLWFGVYRRENATEFLGNPQLFAIVSGRGVELGFYMSTHPSDFSNSDLKARLRAAAPAIYRQLPDPGSTAATELERSLGSQWDFRQKSRLEPGRREFDDLSAWLRYFKSPAGAQEGGGGITRWFTGEDLDAADLSAVVRDMAHTFQPLMSSIRATADHPPLLAPDQPARVGRSFATLFNEMAQKFRAARQQPFGQVPDLWNLMEEIQTRLDNLASVAKRPHIITQWSLGKGVWASVPWIALLNREVTMRCEHGALVVNHCRRHEACNDHVTVDWRQQLGGRE